MTASHVQRVRTIERLTRVPAPARIEHHFRNVIRPRLSTRVDTKRGADEQNDTTDDDRQNEEAVGIYCDNKHI